VAQASRYKKDMITPAKLQRLLHTLERLQIRGHYCEKCFADLGHFWQKIKIGHFIVSNFMISILSQQCYYIRQYNRKSYFLNHNIVPGDVIFKIL
jgi:hypothetical protein